MNSSKFISQALITLSFFIGMKPVFSSNISDNQDANSSAQSDTHKIIHVIPHTPGDILICEKITDSTKVTIVDASLLTRQVTDGSKYYTSLTGEVIGVDQNQG